MMYEIYQAMPNESDFTPLKQAGIAGFNFAHIGGKYRYHTMTENPDNLDRRSLQHQGSYALSLTQHFGNMDLTNLRRDSNLVYFNILNLGMLYYPEAWALPLAVLTALLFFGLVMFGRARGRISLAGLLVGALAFLLNLVLSAGLVWLVWQALLKLYPHYGAVIDTPNGLFYWLACITLALAVTAAFYSGLGRRLSVADLALGALLVWLVPTVVVSQAMPGVSYWLTWPLLFSLIGLGLLWLLPDQGLAPWRRAVLLAAAGVPVLVIFSWSIYAFYLALGTDQIIVPVLLVPWLLGLFIPHLDFLARPFRLALPAVAGCVAVAALIGGSLTAAPDALHPQPDSIFYALNADTGQALWISEDSQPDVWTSQFLGTAFKRGQLPELLPHLSNEFLSAPAPVLNLATPQVDVLADRSTASVRTLDLHVTVPGQTPWVEVSIRSDNPISAITLAGTRIPYEEDPAQLGRDGGLHTFQYWMPPAQGFDLAVEIAPRGSVEISVRGYGYGLPHVPGLDYDPRPADRMPRAREFLPNNRTDTVLVSKTFAFEQQE